MHFSPSADVAITSVYVWTIAVTLQTPRLLSCLQHMLSYQTVILALQQPRGYGGYHGVDGSQEQEDGIGEASPCHTKENHMPRELRRLHDHSMSWSDNEAKSTHPGGGRRTRASSVPDSAADTASGQQPLATQSADQAAKKRYSAVAVWLLFRLSQPSYCGCTFFLSYQLL